MLYNVENSSTTITQDWITSLTIGLKNLVFWMVGHNYQAHIFNVVVRVNQLVWRNVFVGVVRQVKDQCSNATKMFVGKLEMCFPNCELMNALNIMYPQI